MWTILLHRLIDTECNINSNPAGGFRFQLETWNLQKFSPHKDWITGHAYTPTQSEHEQVDSSVEVMKTLIQTEAEKISQDAGLAGMKNSGNEGRHDTATS